jgi:transcriptional regulator with XRE-family HTH domain
MSNFVHIRLKSIRESQGLTLAALSKETGGALSTSRIANYESGIRELKVPQAIILAKALKTDAAFLLGLTNVAAEDWIEETDMSASKKELYVLMQQVARMQDTDVTQATAILKALIKHS